MKKLKKIILVMQRVIVKKMIYINDEFYMKHMEKYLKKIGVQLHGTPKFIYPDVYFDGFDYSKISLGDNITISKEVMFLTHDYSITTAMASIGNKIPRGEEEMFFLKSIVVGDNCFIGARSSILPGTKIGNNVIVGAGAVVKGNIPNNSIVIGNPAKIIGRTDIYAQNHKEKGDYLFKVNGVVN